MGGGGGGGRGGGVSRARFPLGPHLRGSRFSRLPPLRLPPARRFFQNDEKLVELSFIPSRSGGLGPKPLGPGSQAPGGPGPKPLTPSPWEPAPRPRTRDSYLKTLLQGVVVVLTNVEPPEKPPPSTSLKDAVEALLCRYLEDAKTRAIGLGQHMASPCISIPGIQTWARVGGYPVPASLQAPIRGSRFSRFPPLRLPYHEMIQNDEKLGAPPLEAPAPSP